MKTPFDIAATAFLKASINAGHVPSCINCINWDMKAETCTHYGARPPAEVIVFSCGDAWDIDIPF